MPLPPVEPADYQDLRLAVVMNGGVSLAVWIGGVTGELHLIQKKGGAYSRLLELTATRVQADVISGTSAGGINGAFLALARAYGTDLVPLRDLWVEKGALEKLLYAAGEKEPRSLLRGDYFREELRKAFEMLAKGALTDASAHPVDLTLTTTLLHGVPNPLADDFGTPIHDSNHRGHFNFHRDGESDDFASHKIAEHLALAARCTASFPLAFESQFAEPITGTVANGRSITSFHTPRFLLDGGILDNKPLDHAIEAVRRQRDQGDVRRVLCYVVPSPEKAATGDPDSLDHPPSVLHVGIASLAGIPMAQSISAQVRQILDHNHQVRELRRTRLAVASLGWEAVARVAGQLFESYRKRRVSGLASYIAEEAAKGIAAGESGQRIGRRRQEWIANLFMEVFREGQPLPWVPRYLPVDGQHLPDPKAWDWGLFTTENVANVVLDLLRQGIRFLPIRAESQTAAGQAKATLRSILGEASAESVRLSERREADHQIWRRRGTALKFETRLGLQWVRDCAKEHHQQLQLSGQAAYAFARLLERAASSLHTAASSSINGGMAGAEEFASLVELLVSDSGHALTAELILERLLNLEVAQFAFGISITVRDLADQILQLAQISADNSAELAVGLSAGRKPVGAQLANFGGFYKRSWRAFDWVLGRLHGVERLLRIVLDPERIAGLYRELPLSSVLDELARIAVPESGPDRNACLKWWNENQERVRDELAFLSAPAALAPEQLPATVKGLLHRFELSILREELENVVVAVQQDIDERHAPRAGQQFLDVVKLELGPALAALTTAPGEVIQTLWNKCCIGDETFAEEMASDRFVATLAQASLIGTSVLRGKNSGFGAASRLFAFLRWPAKLAHAIAQSLLGESKSSVAVFAAIAAASLTVPLLAWLTNAKIPWAILGIACGAFVIATIMFVLMPGVRRGFHWAYGRVRRKRGPKS